MVYFGTRLSENISRREPEGYLICLNVPVARTGTQEYLPSELGIPDPDDHLVPVFRPPNEVFSSACMASFEGMPVTDDHPRTAEGVTAENIRFLQKGHAHNVRRAALPEDDLLLADLIITDPDLIDEILSGKREISCGYTYTLAEENGRYIQRDIRGNHVAVVDAGRAGPRVSIKDAKKERSTPIMTKSKWRARVLARMARDGDVEGMAELISEILEPVPEAAVNPSGPDIPAVPAAGDPLVSAVISAVSAAAELAPEEAPVVVETPTEQPVVVDCGPEILEALNRIISLLSGSAADCGGPCRKDEAPEESIGSATGSGAESAIEEAAEEAAEETVEAVAEAVASVLEEAADPAGVPADPVEELVAEILESAGPEAPDGEEEIVSAVLEPEGDEDPEDSDHPENLSGAEDALKAALAAFRPQLAKMKPETRKKFNADVAARMKNLQKKKAGDGKNMSAYAALRLAAARDRDERTLGQQIMKTRNANLSR